MEELVWYKKVLGYLYPITISKQENEQHPNLQIKYYQGQYQLESGGALYSDGHRYTPFRLAYRFLEKKNSLKNTEDFLLLGAGLGSALKRLHEVYKMFPTTYLVEQDADILACSKKYLLNEQTKNIHFIQDDALVYLLKTKNTFDLIGVDLFHNLENSSLLKDPKFWEQVVQVCKPKTTLIVNTIFTKKVRRENFEKLLSLNFTFEKLKHKPNYIYILNLKN